MTPYQEVASGANNEKFNSDYGTGIPPIVSRAPKVTIDKSSSPSTVPLGGTVTYSIPFQNAPASEGSVRVGMPDYGMPLVISDTIPMGMVYVGGSAGATVPGGVQILYSTDGGKTWSNSQPALPGTVTTIQWWLNTPLEPGTGGTATYQAQVPNTYLGASFIENKACAGFGQGAPFACDTVATMVQGTNSIGDLVWKDEDADGVFDAGEPGIGDILLSLYWDKNGNGVLDATDPLIQTTNSSASGAVGSYSFSQLPNGNFLVQVDQNDLQVPVGYNISTRVVIPVTGLGTTLASPFNAADFGFGPVLKVDKQLTSGNPAYEAENVTFNIRLVNTRPGDGTARGACTYTVWARAEDTPRTSNKKWSYPENAFTQNEPNSIFAFTDYKQGAGKVIAGTSFSLGAQPGTITKVEAIFPIYFDKSLVDDFVIANLYNAPSPAAAIGTKNFTTAELNNFAPGISKLGLLTWDVTGLRAWTWADFSNFFSLSLQSEKTANEDAVVLSMDAMGFRITSDQTCGSTSDIIATLPFSDTYDAARLQYITAAPPPDSASSGLLKWNNLGPLYAGQTKTLAVTFKALQPPDSNGNGEPDPVQTINYAISKWARFGDGLPVNNTSDAENVTINPTGSIGDTIWNDSGLGGGTRNDGKQNGGEPGIPGVTVTLQVWEKNSWVVKATAVTDSNGKYLFEGLKDNTYRVLVNLASLPGTGYTQTGDPDETGRCIVCDSTSGSRVLNNNNGISTDDDYLSLDFGYLIQNTVFGNVWQDMNGNGTIQSGDNGLSGITVWLRRSSDNTIYQTTTTDANGNYRFVDIPDGNYYVQVNTASLPQGGSWSNTADPENNFDSRTNSVSMTGGNIYGAYNFGYYRTGLYFIGDTIYADWDGDGTQDNGEGGIPGVDVWLYEDANGDGLITPGIDAFISTRTTDANGHYSFDNLPPGNYLVIVDQSDLPAGYVQTHDPVAPCITCGGKAKVTLTDAGNNSIDFSYRPTGYSSIGDRVWRDDDHDGVQDGGEAGINGVTVRLYLDTDGDGVIDANEPLVGTAITDVNGLYSFYNLPAGNYLVDVDTASAGIPLDPSGVRYILSTENDPLAVSLAASQAYLDADFGFTPGGSIGDLIWQDNNGNGTPDTGEPGLPGIPVYLYNDVNANGVYDVGVDTQVGSPKTTDASGKYLFTSLPAGNYVVWVDTAAVPNMIISGDPDVSPPCNGGCNNESGLYLYPGQTNWTRDFGFQPKGVIGDTLWIDSNGNGVRDAGESGLSGMTVDLYQGGVLQKTTLTDPDGYYSFGNLTDGTYQVVVNTSGLPTGLSQSYDPDQPGTIPCTSCDNQATLTLTGGGANLNGDFGYRYFGSYSVSGTVFYDSGNDGGDYSPPNDLPYGNITVYLWDSQHNLIASTLTAADGTYSFSNLPPGSYSISVNNGSPSLSGMQATTPEVGKTHRSVTITNANVPNQDFGFTSNLDFGDLPDSYGTRLMSEGARHTIGNLYMGTAPDADGDSLPNATATGDDGRGASDEDGVSMAGWGIQPGETFEITIAVSGSNGYLVGFFDWNGDGDFGEADETIEFGPVPAGVGSYPVDVPITAAPGNYLNVRFRLYDGDPGIASPLGLAYNGEVEDYHWPFMPTAVMINGPTAIPGVNAIRLEWRTLLGLRPQSFNLYRSQSYDGDYSLLNASPIPAQIPGFGGQAKYLWMDSAVELYQTYFYKLEVVESDGTSSFYGPVMGASLDAIFLPAITR